MPEILVKKGTKYMFVKLNIDFDKSHNFKSWKSTQFLDTIPMIQAKLDTHSCA
jgi:hypothetical protein